MFCRVIQFFIPCIWLTLCSTSVVVAQSSIVIDPNRQTGATVRYFGWDAKLNGGFCSQAKAAKWLYKDSGANLMRIPIRPQLSTPDGQVIMKNDSRKENYLPVIKSIQMAKSMNPDVKIFASTKLAGKKTFPPWLESDKTGEIFNAEVKCPHPEKYAEVLKNYFGMLAAAQIKIDYLGLNNEVGGALKPEIYLETAKRLVRKLKQSEISDEYKTFKWLGCEEFGVPGSLNYAKALLKLRAVDFVDVVGSHFYPDKPSGAIEHWQRLSSLGVPCWHTEVHVRESDEARANMLALRDGMSLVFKVNQAGCEGYVWWAGGASRKNLTNLIRHQMIKTMLYGSCVQTSGSYLAKDNPPDKAVAQATRVGDTVWLWLFNPSRAIDRLPVKFSNGVIEAYRAGYWTGSKQVNAKSTGQLTVKRARQDQLEIERVPALSITLLEVKLEDDEMLLPVKNWQLLKPKKRSLEAALTKVSGKTLHFATRQGKTVIVSGKDISPEHHQEIRDAMRAHGQL